MDPKKHVASVIELLVQSVMPLDNGSLVLAISDLVLSVLDAKTW